MAPVDYQYVTSLSNKELAARLREYGVQVGPVVQSTRGLYEKKLLKLETNQEQMPRFKEVPHDESEEESEDEDFEEEEEPVPVRQVRNDTRRRVPAQSTPPRFRREIHPEKTERVTTRSINSAPTNVSTGKRVENSSGFPILKVLIFILVLVAVGYLVIKNMEPEAENNIPDQYDAQV